MVKPAISIASRMRVMNKEPIPHGTKGYAYNIPIEYMTSARVQGLPQ